MQYTDEVVPRHVHGTVDHKAGLVDAVVGRLDLVALHIDLDQGRGGDLVEHHAVGIEQKMILRVRHARRDEGSEQIRSAEQR